MIKSAFALSAAISFQADATPYGPHPSWEDAVRLGNSAIQKSLIDPESARIEWPFTLIGGTLTLPNKPPASGWYTCGWVNAKNRMGGYVGRSRFLIMFQQGQPTIVEVGGHGGGGLAESVCVDLASKGWLRSSGLEALGAMAPSQIAPSSEATRQAYQTLADAGAQQRGGMGLALLSTPAGAVIMAIAPGSPAERAGLKVGQVIESVGGVSAKGMPLEALSAIISNLPDEVELKIAGLGPIKVLRHK